MLDNCYVPGMQAVEDAIGRMLEAATHIPFNKKSECIPLSQAFNRITSQDIISNFDVPPCDNSAMDGYALKASDLEETNVLVQVGVAYAGKPFDKTLEKGQCIRIMTGAPIPDGADTVIMQEQTEKIDSVYIKFLEKKSAGNNVRKAGENIARYSTVIKTGTRLNAAKLGMLASLGEANIHVFNKLTVGILATGDELVEAGIPLVYGQIYESNRLALKILLEQFGAKVIDYGIVADNKSSINQVLTIANNECDVILTNGGVSVGDADFVKDVLDELGTVNFWKVAIKPGKPFAFGRLSNAWFCGLPGNPVSSYVTCQQLVIPFLSFLQQNIATTQTTYLASAEVEIKKRKGRKDYQRGIYTQLENGSLVAKPYGPQGSGIMSSIANANCYIVLDEEQDNVIKGGSIRIMPFNQLCN